MESAKFTCLKYYFLNLNYSTIHNSFCFRFWTAFFCRKASLSFLWRFDVHGGRYRYHHVATSDGPKKLKEGSLFVFFAGDRLCYWSVPVKRLSHPSESRGGLYPRSQMHSGKGLSSIVVEHSGVIYVLANDIFYPFRPAHTFEVYDPTSDTWYALKPPPFHYPGATYMTLSYVVMGNHICVSTEKENGAWAYYFDAREWEPCSLLCDYYKPRKFSSDGTGKSLFQILRKIEGAVRKGLYPGKCLKGCKILPLLSKVGPR